MKTFIVFTALVAVAVAAPQLIRKQIFTTNPGRRIVAAAPAPSAFLPAAAPAPAPAPVPAPAFVAAPAPAFVSAPASNDQVYLLRELPSDNIGLDSYRFAYEQSDGQKREESAQVDSRDPRQEPILRVQGSYSYVGPDGQTYTITYIADENGFQPQGAHIPVV